MTRTHWITGGIAALAATAAFGQAQRAPAPMPAPRMPVPVSALLPNTQGLFDGYVHDDKMPGIVGAFGVGDGPTLFPSAGRIADGGAAANADSLWRV